MLFTITMYGISQAYINSNFMIICQDVPFYIFCESYGGKMVAAFGAMLHKVN